jgi:hypothetical protein
VRGSAFDVSPHVGNLSRFFFGKWDVGLFYEELPDIEWPPANFHPCLRGLLFQSHDRQVAVGATEVEEEVDMLRHWVLQKGCSAFFVTANATNDRHATAAHKNSDRF